MMTVYLGSRQVVFFNTYDVIKETFSKHGHEFSGRPQDLFLFTEIMTNSVKTNCFGRKPYTQMFPNRHSLTQFF